MNHPTPLALPEHDAQALAIVVVKLQHDISVITGSRFMYNDEVVDKFEGNVLGKWGP